MTTITLITLMLTTTPNPQAAVPGTCGPVTIYIVDGSCAARPAAPRYNRLPPARYFNPAIPPVPAAKPPAVPQVRRDPGEPAVPAAPAFLTNRHVPGVEYGMHTTTLFPTAETVDKGHAYYDFQFLGLYSGVQYGMTENLELGVKVIVPFAIATAIEHDLLEPFLKYGVHVSAKYRFYKGEHLSLSARVSLPLPSAELIGTLKYGRFDVTGAVGIMLPLETDVAMTWTRATARFRISPELHLFAEYAAMRLFDGYSESVTSMATVALRRIKGRFSYDLGFGAMKMAEADDEYDDGVDIPIVYINFGYAL